MTVLFSMAALIYGVMAVYRAVTFSANDENRNRTAIYFALLVSVCLLDAITIHELIKGKGWTTLAPLPGLGLATTGLSILIVRSWLARHGISTTHKKAYAARYLGWTCLVGAILVGFYVAPYTQFFMSPRVTNVASIIAVLLAGFLLVAIVSPYSHTPDHDGRFIISRGLGYAIFTALAFVAVALFHLSLITKAPSHLGGVAIIFMLLVVSGLGVARMDGCLG